MMSPNKHIAPSRTNVLAISGPDHQEFPTGPSSLHIKIIDSYACARIPVAKSENENAIAIRDRPGDVDWIIDDKSE